MVKKIRDQKRAVQDTVTSKTQTAPIEFKARGVLNLMTELGRVRDMKTREKLARNLGRILSERKQLLNLSDLVVRAGVSENNDPNRLGRFRILPDKKVSDATIRRLNQDPHAYHRIVKEVSRATGESPHELLLELVIETKFEGAELAKISIEPFEQLFALIQKKIDALDAKYDLSGYFRTIREHELVPIWANAPLCDEGRRTSHHSYGRSELIGWEICSGRAEFRSWRYQTLPCVPLCYVTGPLLTTRSPLPKPHLRASLTFEDDEHVHVELAICNRLYLAIGMFDHSYLQLSPPEMKTFEEPFPRPYFIGVSEFHVDTDAECGWAIKQQGVDRKFPPVTGGANSEQQPFYFYDHEAGVDIEETEKEYDLICEGTCGYLGFIETVFPVHLQLFREVLGKPSPSALGERGDALVGRPPELTLSPRSTIASRLEANLLGRPRAQDEADHAIGPNALDVLEGDVERMTSSLQKWLDETQADLKHRHVTLMEEFEKEIQEGKR